MDHFIRFIIDYNLQYMVYYIKSSGPKLANLTESDHERSFFFRTGSLLRQRFFINFNEYIHLFRIRDDLFQK